MARIETLPERLQYLRPFQEFLTKLPKAEVGEFTDNTLLEKLIRKRLRGMSSEEAKKALGADLQELKEFCSVGRRGDDVRLGFILGFLWVASEMPEELLKPAIKPRKIVERLRMELPRGAKSSIDQYSLSVEWMGQNFHALRLDMEDAFSHEFTLARLAHPNASEHELLSLIDASAAERVCPNPIQDRAQAISVNLGKVVGHKHVACGEPPNEWKRADYLLKIPAGYVSVSIQAGHLFDESWWETYLTTLHFSKPRSSAVKRGGR
jgi:hypothetical protein